MDEMINRHNRIGCFFYPVFLYGLQADPSIKYTATFYTFPALLFFIALFCFVSLMVKNNKD